MAARATARSCSRGSPDSDLVREGKIWSQDAGEGNNTVIEGCSF
jgi:hypothetical protein